MSSTILLSLGIVTAAGKVPVQVRLLSDAFQDAELMESNAVVPRLSIALTGTVADMVPTTSLR